MKRLLFSLSICLVVLDVRGQDKVEFALSALPEDLRDGAQVVELSESGENVVLKEGDNGVTCRVPMEGSFFVLRCNPVSDQALFDRLDSMVVRQGMGWFDARDQVFEEIKAGMLKAPILGSTHYFVAGVDQESAGLVSLIFLPMVMAKDIGMGVEKDDERPWMMWEGTELAHVMIYGEWKQ
jgi:hypothetical protein